MDKLILGSFLARFRIFFPLTLIFASSLLIILTGCLPGTSTTEIQRICIFPTDIENGGRLSVFLNLERPNGPHISVKISKIEVLVDEEWYPLLAEPPLELDSRKIGRWQVFVGSRELHAGNVSRLRILIDSAYLSEDGGAISTLLVENSSNEIYLSDNFELTAGDSKTINLIWDVDASLVTGMALEFAAIAIPARKENLVTANLAYVACPDIDTIYIINTNDNWVVGSFGVEGKPAYIFIDGAQKKLFVMAMETNIIKIFDLASNHLLDEIIIPMTKHPVSMAVRPDFIKAYVIDENGYLIKIDLGNGNLEERIKVGQQPNYVTYVANQDRLAISSTYDRTVYIINPENMQVEQPVELGGTPHGLLVFNDLLYIAEEDTNTISVFDLLYRRYQNRITTGSPPYRLMAVADKIYVSNRKDGTLSLLRERSTIVSKMIFVGENVQEMASSESQGYLYVGNGKCDGSLAVVDIHRDTVIGRIELGAFPRGVTFYQ